MYVGIWELDDFWAISGSRLSVRQSPSVTVNLLGIHDSILVLIEPVNNYLLKCFRNAQLTQYNATGLAQLFANDKQNPVIRNTCQKAL